MLVLTAFFNNYLLFAAIVTYIIDRLFWDIITTWYYIDILQGSIIYFEKKYIKYNFYKWMVIIELIIINYKKCIKILLNWLINYSNDTIIAIKYINIINFILSILIYIYNIYLRVQYYLIRKFDKIKINGITFNSNYKLKIYYKNKISILILFQIFKKLKLDDYLYILTFTQIYLFKIVYKFKIIFFKFKLITLNYLNIINNFIKLFLFFKKFDDLNNKLIPISTFETNLVISLAVVETNIYTFHIFNLTIAHNLDVYINNELGDEDMIESSVEDIGDWKECFDEYVEYKIIDVTDPVILNIYLTSKLLNEKLDQKISYYCKNYELIIYDFIFILIDTFLSNIYIYIYNIVNNSKINLRTCLNYYTNTYIFIKNSLIKLLNIKFSIIYLCFKFYNLDFIIFINFIYSVINYCLLLIIIIKQDIINIIKNLINIIKNIKLSIDTIKLPLDSILLGIEIYYVNNKLPYKLLKNNLKLFLIKYLDYLEYCMLSHKFYRKRNIKKYYKKQYNPIKIKNELNDNLLILIKQYLLYFKNLYLKNTLFIYDLYDKCTNYLYITNYFKYNFSIYIETYMYLYIKELQILYTNNIIYNYLIKLFHDLNSILSALILIGYPNNIIRDIKKIKCHAFNIEIKQLKFNYINCAFKNYNYYNNVNCNKIINLIINFYFPIFITNYIISDLALSFNILFKKYKKIFVFLYNNCYNFAVLFKLLFKKFKNLMFLILNMVYSKTIYITFLISYFFNRYFIDYIYFDVYLKYTSIFKFKYKYYISIIEIFINWNFLIVTISLAGILLVLKWSRSVHRFFGYFFWTMIIFPIFIETHKILYTKLILENYLNIDSIGFVIALKLNLLNIFNYKLYNFFYLVTLLIFFFFIIYIIKQGAFRHIYANFKAARWKYIKYPVFIYLIELARLKCVELICIFMLYLSCKYNIYSYSYYFCWKFSQNYSLIKILNFIKKYIIEFENPECYYFFYTIFIPNPFIINILIDTMLFLTTLNWLLVYCREFKKSDKKFVAFPLYVSEIFYKYIARYYICYYLLINLLIWISDGKLIWYGTQSLFVIFLYLDIRVHKIPKKTMAWYFRQIVDLWPLTCSMLWTTPKYLYQDQQKYLSMRQKLRIPKKNFKMLYNKAERWEKKIIFTFQRDKEIELYKFTAFCKLMSRKENMLREFNVFDYQGWQEDWTYCYKKINIFNWKLDWWDKPYIYLFKKLIYLANMQICYFNHFPIIYRFSCKFTHLNGIHNFVKFFDYFYSNVFIFKFSNNYKYNHLLGLIFRGRKYKSSCIDWKLNAHAKFDEKEELIHLKKLKLVLMEFSCGLRDKTPDWVFPSVYAKQYKKDGWKMFEDGKIDSVSIDWRPKIRKW